VRFDPGRHHRRSIRLKGYDYSQAGAYFVTIVAWQREMLFGDVVNEEIKLNEMGEIVADKWQWLETQYPYIELGAWIVMPNHFHGILVIHDDGRGGSRSAHAGDSRIAPTPIKRKPLGGLIGAFKTVSTKQINLLRDTEGQTVWQRNYYEHIIRNDREMDRIHRYIESNPLQWDDDDENPNRRA
jgi:REP element-mobilizing transposase RayT